MSNSSDDVFGAHGSGNDYMVSDQSTGQASGLSADVYDGPDQELHHQIMLLTSHNINVTGQMPFSFIHTGSGEDAIDVSHVNGDNVLDGGTGSNFLVGGSGHDTFFVDDRGAASDIWSTVSNFHSGEDVTVWGLTKNDFNIGMADDKGAVGATGLTWTMTAPGKANASLTLTGYGKSALDDGRLSVSFGRTDDLPGLSGSNYMMIHAI
jgi:serralysin